MPKLRALVAAAGRGTRAGLPYPKTLFPIHGLPILIRILRVLAAYDDCPTVIVSPEGRNLVSQCLKEHVARAELVTQDEPRGMGDAVLRFAEAVAFGDAEHVLLIWGDIPFVQASSVEALILTHFQHQNDFTLLTRFAENAYTVVSRDKYGRLTGVCETRESGASSSANGERDIGLFVFRKKPVFDLLQKDLPGKVGLSTGEHGFLYVIEHLVRNGHRVEALPVATELDLVSLNTIEDIREYL